MILSKFRDIEAQRSSGRSRKMRFSSCVYGSVHVSMSHNIGTGRCNHEPIHKYMTYIFSMLIYIYIFIFHALQLQINSAPADPTTTGRTCRRRHIIITVSICEYTETRNVCIIEYESTAEVSVEDSIEIHAFKRP